MKKLLCPDVFVGNTGFKVFILSAIMLLHVFQMTYAREHESSQTSVYLVDFKFEKRDLKDILNEFAQLRGINILYSSTAQLNAKVTFDAGKKITFMKAWEFLLMMLEQAGFSLINQGKDMYALVGSDLVGTTPLPIYINSDVDELPLTQERIRYIYYFKNISLTNQQNDLSAVLKNFFDSKSVHQQLIFDTNFNAMIVTAKSEIIKAVMKFVDVFDQAGEKQITDVFDLQYANSTEVAKILTDLIAGQDTAKSKTAQKPAAVDLSAVFSPGTRVISLFSNLNSGYGGSSTAEYANTLVILGKKTDVQQVKKFIQEHLDIPIEQGKSFFHVIELQWLSASALSSILQDLITPPGGSGQSTNVSLSNLSFDPQIKIVPEAISQGLSPSTDLSQPLASGVSNNVQRGSNKIIVAATNKDWTRIEDVIKKLDIPQKQVVIEALILDLALVFTHKLASQIRTNGLSSSIFPKSMQAQAAMLLPAIPSGEVDPLSSGGFSPSGVGATGLEGDLSKLLEIIAPIGGDDQTANSTFFMIGDKQNSNGIWAFFQLLALHASSKTISRAFVIAQNNMPAVVTNNITKRLPGKLTAGVTATISYQTVAAPVTVSFTPLISANDIVNLQIQVDATYWQDPTGPISGTSSNREIQTNFSMKDGQVAILGGLTKNQIDISFNGVPFFSKIPIIGPLFFSNKRHTEDKVKLFMIVRTTVTKPRHDGGMGKVTRRMAAVTNHLLQDDDDDGDLFSSIKDPISRWIFDEGEPMRRSQADMPLKDLFTRGNSTVNFL
ncbi:MAG: secretin N-terminal domain-containing protein [Candidatus Chromulinivorax sp.]|nr:secretin N-terminal domain-containing protein [Candidatus Chromulinivorax sp.]